mmetsp:Transcript_30714/g.52451  ORF Transcript_30714/g.52451 Transcript_30714/m.52451 type:complete len:862 (+) Transcript_30714:75-2660(+)
MVSNVTELPLWMPDRYKPPPVLKLLSRLPRYGYTRDISSALFDDLNENDNDYIWGIAIFPCCLLLFLLVWCVLLLFFKFHSDSWASGCLARPMAPSYEFHSIQGRNVTGRGRQEVDDDTSSTSVSSGSCGSISSELSMDSSIFRADPTAYEELTMSVIAREQKRDPTLRKMQKKKPQNYSTTTNGRLTLVTMLDHCKDQERGSCPQFRVYIPPSLRLQLLRTYHKCLVSPDNVSNANTMIYEFFTWKEIKRDVSSYFTCYKRYMRQGGDGAVLRFGNYEELDDNAPITLDVIAQEQKEDTQLAFMMKRAPSVFSSATNGSIQLITARGKDNKYRIVIPTSLQAKVLKTYHDCLVNPTKDSNFKRVLYVHFTWNGIHKDVEKYIINEGLTEEMKLRNCQRTGIDDSSPCPGSETIDCDSVGIFHIEREKDPSSVYRPIGLDEIATEQKKDRELRRLKKEEPFVFSTVRYGDTLLTTAQNFRDNKYRIVIPRRLQRRMLRTYQDCLLNPTPDRNFDTLLYNHFTWNGIHDDVDYFVKNCGHFPEREPAKCENETCDSLRTLEKQFGKKPGGPIQSDVHHSDCTQQDEKVEEKMKWIRTIFLICGVLMITSSVVFFEHGVSKVFVSIIDIQDGLQQTEYMANSALSATEYFSEIQPKVRDIARVIGTFNTSQIQCFPATTQSSLGEFELQLQNSTHDIGTLIRDTAVRVTLELRGIELDLERMIDLVQSLDATLEDFKTYIEVLKILVILLDIVVISLMIACILAWIGEQHLLPLCVRKTIITPLFVTLLILFWALSTAVLVAAMLGSDVCSKPDESATALVMGIQNELSPLTFMLIIHYLTVSSCCLDGMPEFGSSICGATNL